MSGALLEVRALQSPFGGPFDLTLAAGECVCVTGASGSGKSVLLRLIADLDPGEGSVRLDGRDRTAMTAPQWRRRVVYQSAEPVWWAAAGASHFAPDQRASAITTMASLDLAAALLDADISRLSTGERQRLALVRSLSVSPAVLLLDEPTAALDAESIEAVERVLEDCLSHGIGIVMVTHSREQAARLGHRRFEMRDHRLHDA